MAGFALCARCEREYTDPADRRFHAETTCCPDCGPRLSLPPAAIWELLAGGAIVAIQGIGGYHLACDARDEAAVARLRIRKQREAKPLAVMVANLASARRLARIDEAAAACLGSRERPIVVLDAEPGNGIARSVSMGLPTLGLMLPYTPIHHLLFHAAAGAPADAAWRHREWPAALVMTSANPHGEPLVHTAAEARARLVGIADAIVDHDRAIAVRCDDSVLRMVDGAPAFIRRARGYVPEPIDLGREFPPLLATGAYLKNAVCVTRGREAFVSQHVGDLDGPEARRFQHEAAAHLLRILDVRPTQVVGDLHPDFPGRALADAADLPWVAVQHLATMLRPGERIVRDVVTASPAWRDLLGGRRRAVPAADAGSAPAPGALVFPGSFDPLHEGHRLMARLAEEIAERPLGAAQFAGQRLWLTGAARFREKLEIFPAGTFVMGADTYSRLADPRFYGGSAQAAAEAVEAIATQARGLIVFGRTRDGVFEGAVQIDAPQRLREISYFVSQREFRLDISSTELRRRETARQEAACDL